MKNYIINNIISGNEVYHRKMEYTCSLCKSDKLSDSIFQKRDIKSLLTKSKMKQADLSTLINKCNCTRNSPKAHKLCVLLNVIYNFDLKCPECNTEYNISTKIFHLSKQKIWNLISLILVLLINIIFYGASVFLFLYPFVIKKNFEEKPEQKKFLICYCFFGAVIFVLNTFLIYITFNMFLLKNPNDSNSYAIEIKDINDQNKKKTDRHYILLYKFFRSFYKTQTRYLITKKHKNIFISKGYGYFNKELKEMIIKNNLECEKELEEEINGGDEILGLKENKADKKSSNKDNDEKNSNNLIEKSNGNIDNSNSSDIEDNKNNEESKSKIKSNNKINANLNLGSGKDNNILNKSENDSKKENNSKKSNSEISDESLKKKKKKIVIEIINTDKQKNIVKNSSLQEERKNQDNESNKTKKSDSNKIKKNRNKKNEVDSSSSKNKSENNKKFEESKESLYNRKEEKKESSKKIKLVEDPNIFNNDNEDLFISTPFHNNGK